MKFACLLSATPAAAFFIQPAMPAMGRYHATAHSTPRLSGNRFDALANTPSMFKLGRSTQPSVPAQISRTAPVLSLSSQEPNEKVESVLDDWMFQVSALDSLLETAMPPVSGIMTREVCSRPNDVLAPIVAHLPLHGRVNSLLELDAFIRHRATELLGLSSIETRFPPTRPSTACQVVMLDDVAVFKVFLGEERAFLQELLANTLLQQHLGSIVAPFYEVGRVEIGETIYPYIIMRSAKGADLEAMSLDVAQRGGDFQQLRRAVGSVGETAATLHAAFSGVPHANELASLRDYNLRYVERLLGDDGVLVRLQRANWLTDTQFEVLHRYVEKLLDHYRAPEILAVLAGAVVHGDMHLGNVVYDEEMDRLQLIDNETLAWSLSQWIEHLGCADPAEDSGRFLEGLRLCGIRFGLSAQQQARLEQDYIDGYHRVNTDGPVLGCRTIEFFRLRYVAVILESIVRCWCEDRPTCDLKIGESVAHDLVNHWAERAAVWNAQHQNDHQRFDNC